MKQSGLITKYPLPQDYVLGSETAVKGKVRTSDWKEYLPATEKQYSIGFDTLSCTSFSFNNVVESQLNFMIKKGEFNTDSIKWLTDNGYIENNKVNLSDRFLAIMSGTTDRGNDFRTVAECARTIGLIPEKDFPLTGNSFTEYHNKSLITQSMKDKAAEFLKRVKISWEWLFFDSASGFNEGVQVENVIQETPIQIAIPTPGTHATMLFGYNKDNEWFKVFDTYEPFFFENNGDSYNPQIGLRVMCSVPVIIAPTPVPSEFIFKNTLVFGSKGNDVVQLQRILISEGLMKVGLDTGNFGSITLQAVKNFQMKYGIRTTGNVGPITMAKLNSILDALKKKPKNKLDAWALAIQTFEGYSVGSRSYRNHNPGNIKYVGQSTAIGKDDKGFCVFPSYQVGFEALKSLLRYAASGKSKLYKANGSLYQFFNVYAPSSDNNNPNQYAEFVARSIGVDPNTIINTLIV